MTKNNNFHHIKEVQKDIKQYEIFISSLIAYCSKNITSKNLTMIISKSRGNEFSKSVF